VALLLGIELFEEPLDLIVRKAREGEIHVRRDLQAGKQAREQRLIPYAADLLRARFKRWACSGARST
jgi:hypothetical protein